MGARGPGAFVDAESSLSFVGFSFAEFFVLPRHASPEWLEGSGTRQPLLVAFVAFCLLTSWSAMTQFLVCRPSLRFLLDHWSKQLHRGFAAHSLVSFVGMVEYSHMYLGSSQVVLAIPGAAEHLILRNMVWALSNPIQWYVFICSFTSAGPDQLKAISLFTGAMHVFGMLMHCSRNPRIVWLFFWLSCASFLAMFKVAFELPLLRETEVIATRFLVAKLVLWILYPITTFARLSGMISLWSEQVLLYSVLDVIAKCVTFLSVVVSRILLTLDTLAQTSKLVTASHDLIVIVDEAFSFVEILRSKPSLRSLVEAASSERGLLGLCINEEHTRLLTSAAATCDSQPTGAALPKCVVSFELPRGMGGMSVECIVSREVHGRRMLGISLLCISGAGLSTE